MKELALKTVDLVWPWLQEILYYIFKHPPQSLSPPWLNFKVGKPTGRFSDTREEVSKMEFIINK